MNIEFGKRLYEYRKSNGYSQEELADKLNVSRQTISKWERAESSPDTDNLVALSKLYNITIDELIYGKNDAKASSTMNFDSADKQNSNPQKTDKVDISWNGIHIDSKNGESVHIDKRGIFVNSNDDDFKLEKPKNPWLHALLPLSIIILYLIIGFVFEDGWAVGWILFFIIPIAETLFVSVKTKNPSAFAYPVFVTAVFLSIGMLMHIWHPTWIVFITIPIYYIICDAFKKEKQNKE